MKHLQMYLCLCCEWLYFYSHIRKSNKGHRPKQKEQENSTVIYWKAKHQIPHQVLNYRPSLWQMVMKESFNGSLPNPSVFIQWQTCSFHVALLIPESQGLHELQRMAQAASRIEIAVCKGKRFIPYLCSLCVLPCFSLLFSHQNLNTHTHTPHIWLFNNSPFGVSFSSLPTTKPPDLLRARLYSPHTADPFSLAIQSSIPSNLHLLLLCHILCCVLPMSQWDSPSSPPNPSPISCHTQPSSNTDIFKIYIDLYLIGG